MISIIVCSINSDLREKLKNSIEDTIGTEYEFLYIDNTIYKKGICAVYNRLAEQAKGDYFCFVHEDVTFETSNWGKILVEKASNPAVGVIGFAGVGTMTSFPYWLDRYTNIHYYVQRLKDGSILYDSTNNKRSKDFEHVAVLDGMFLMCRRDVWEATPFDEHTFKEFHIYDVDFSMSAAQSYKNYVCQNIVMSHYSVGSLSKSYYEGMILFHKKWKSMLPYTVYPDVFSRKKKLFYHFAQRDLIKDIVKRTNLSNIYICRFLKRIDFLTSFVIYRKMIKYIFKFRWKKAFSHID